MSVIRVSRCGITRGTLSGKHVLTLIWVIMTGGSFKIVLNLAVLTVRLPCRPGRQLPSRRRRRAFCHGVCVSATSSSGHGAGGGVHWYMLLHPSWMFLESTIVPTSDCMQTRRTSLFYHKDNVSKTFRVLQIKMTWHFVPMLSLTGNNVDTTEWPTNHGSLCSNFTSKTLFATGVYMHLNLRGCYISFCLL